VIVQKGADVKGFEVGDLVTSPATIPCMECFMCKINHANRCTGEKKRILGTHKANGAFTNFLSVPFRILHKIPKSLSQEDASLVESVACITHTVFEVIKIEPGDTVAVLGPGTMGLIGIQAAKISGAKEIFCTGTKLDKQRFDMAKKFGAKVTINVEEEDPVENIKTLTDGLGVDVVLETSGSSIARKQSVEMVRRCGKVGLIGLAGKATDLNLDFVVEKELEVRGTWGTIWTSWKKALNLLNLGMIQVAPLITTKLKLDEWQKGFKMMEKREALKVLLIPF
jgi:threonine dehydrogenase-like Zn-dependent dehydrogenase